MSTHPSCAAGSKEPSTDLYAPILDGPHAGTFAPVGIATIRRIGGIDHKRHEEPDGSGRYVWRVRPTTGVFPPIPS
jgi:hypothetical protein